MSVFYEEALVENGGNKDLALSQAIDRSTIERNSKVLLDQLAAIALEEGLIETYTDTVNTYLSAFTKLPMLDISTDPVRVAYREEITRTRQGE